MDVITTAGDNQNIIGTLNTDVSTSQYNYIYKSSKTNMPKEISTLNAFTRPYCPDTKKGYTVPDEDGIYISRPVNVSVIENNSKIYPSKANVSDACDDTVSNGISISRSDENVYSALNDLRLKNVNRVMIAHININSLRNTFELLCDIIIRKIDILLISETKLDDSFPLSNFKITGFSSPFRLDRSGNGGGIILYTRKDIPAKLLSSYTLPNICECMLIEINLRNRKWLLGSFYNPSKSQISSQLSYLSKALDHYSQLYDNLLIIGDFNSEMSEISE